MIAPALLLILSSAPVLTPAADKQPPKPGPSAQADAWKVEGKVAQPLKHGQPGTLQVQLTTRAGYHVNPDYPINFRTTRGGDWEKGKLERAEMSFSKCDADKSLDCTAQVSAKVTPHGTGTQEFGGVLAFSACNPDRCLIEKVEIAVATPVTK